MTFEELESAIVDMCGELGHHWHHMQTYTYGFGIGWWREYVLFVGDDNEVRIDATNGNEGELLRKLRQYVDSQKADTPEWRREVAAAMGLGD